MVSFAVLVMCMDACLGHFLSLGRNFLLGDFAFESWLPSAGLFTINNGRPRSAYDVQRPGPVCRRCNAKGNKVFSDISGPRPQNHQSGQ